MGQYFPKMSEIRFMHGRNKKKSSPSKSKALKKKIGREWPTNDGNKPDMSMR